MLLWLLAGVLVVIGGGQDQPGRSPDASPGNLRWVRGTITATSSDSVTLKLRRDAMTIIADAATRVVGDEGRLSAVDQATTRIRPDRLAVGSAAEIHYVERRGVRRAVLILDCAGAEPDVSRRPGRSYRAIVKDTRLGGVSLRVEGRTRAVRLDAHTRLLATDGRVIATGHRPIAPMLLPGDEVVVKYDDDNDTLRVGDAMLFMGSEKAIEIRKLQ